jgi:hypothetical protein
MRESVDANELLARLADLFSAKAALIERHITLLRRDDHDGIAANSRKIEELDDLIVEAQQMLGIARRSVN